MDIARIVVLNGPPRSGKSSIVAAMQETGAWMNLGVDVLRQATPPALQPGIGLRPGGERPDLEPAVRQMYRSLIDSVVIFATKGLDVVVDVGLHDAYAKPMGILPAVAPALGATHALFVGIRCPTDVLLERRLATGWGPIDRAIVDRWSAAVHDPGIYDLEIDTSRRTPAEAATSIQHALAAGEPTAFRRIAGRAGPAR